jgi:hypothetical protein
MERNASKTCAYCGAYGPFSREHVIPAFLYRQYPDQKFGYHPKAGRYLEWEAVVGDVCKACNSGPLSNLDAYAKSFTEENRCHRSFRSRPTIHLVYDYQLLLRWLLKVTYNAMRVVDRDTEVLSKCIPYILRSEPLPFSPELLVEVIRDAPIPQWGKHLLPKSMQDVDFLSAHRFRVGEFRIRNAAGSDLSRYVALNAFYFYLVLFRSNTPSEEVRAFLGGIRRELPQATRFRPNRKSVDVKVSKRTIFEAYQDQALRELPAWLQYSAGRDNAKNRFV